ncbi:hemopexin repeat-containing protein [Embleya hyalina]|uniref:Hemopexin n=1 Tax=Embleya hyalina TaxID=516124 RepID=A0A401YWY9_9ACTN|nr:hemopexin repeat-containing protein [Embleya hyalina]GCD99091.1 hypothetical protein EHYA_06803 [Embleya hyalina]
MPVYLAATLDLDDADVEVYGAFIRSIRDHVAAPHGDRVDTSANSDGSGVVTMYRLRRAHARDQADSVFRVRLVGSASYDAESRFSVDFYIQDTDVYGWGFTLTGQTAFHHLSNLPDGVRAMAVDEGFTLHDTGIRESYRSDGLTRGWLNWGTLRDTLARLQTGPDLRANQQPALSFLVEMVCEATRFRRIAAILGRGRWGVTGGTITRDQRDRITQLETSWDSITGLFTDYLTAPGRPVQETTLSRAYGSLPAVAAALTILHVRPGRGGAGSTSTSATGAAQARAYASVASPRLRLYPVLDAAGNQPDANKAWLFRPGTCLTYDLVHNTVATGDPRPIASVWPGLKDTDFPSRIDAVVSVPGSTTDVWLFSGHQYVRYNTSTHRTGGVREIADGWPALGNTSFVDYVDAVVQDPGDRTGGLFFFRDSEVLYYHLATNTIDGPWPIGQHLYHLADTPFALGVSAALNIPGSTEDLWLFQGEDYLRYNIQSHTVFAGPRRIHAGWATLRYKTFVDGVSALLPRPNPGAGPWTQVWMFHDEVCLRFDVDDNVVVEHAGTAAAMFLGLDVHGFADRVDATLTVPKRDNTPHQAWFFHGDHYLRYDLDNHNVDVAPTPIADAWTATKGTAFAGGIDTALDVPGTGDTWFFAGDQYIRFGEWGEVRVPPTPIADGWKGLRDTPFSRRIDAAYHALHIANEVWMFHADLCLRYNLTQDRIDIGPKPIIDTWNLGFPAP